MDKWIYTCHVHDVCVCEAWPLSTWAKQYPLAWKPEHQQGVIQMREESNVFCWLFKCVGFLPDDYTSDILPIYLNIWIVAWCIHRLSRKTSKVDVGPVLSRWTAGPPGPEEGLWRGAFTAERRRRSKHPQIYHKWAV